MSSAPDVVSGVVDSFRCSINEDIEDFMRHKALEFERRGLCTTYLYIGQDDKRVHGYFSLTHKALSIAALSGTRRKDIAGTKNAELAPFILLAQLGRYVSDCSPDGFKSSVSGDAMMKDVFDIIARANRFIVNRRILVECDNEKHLLDFYSRHGFRLLDVDRSDGKCSLYLKLDASSFENI